MADPLSDWAYLWESGDYALCRVSMRGDDPLDGCLICGHKDHSCLIIEDDALARRIMERMVQAGAPILTRDQLPKGKSRAERTIDEMLRAGKTIREINEALRNLRYSEDP